MPISLRTAAIVATLVLSGAGVADDRQGAGSNPLDTPVGGVNAADPAPPPKLAIDTADVTVTDTFSIRVPTGKYEAPEGGAANYSVPGPIVAFKGPDGQWRGHGYLETYPRLLAFESEQINKDGGLYRLIIHLTYTFEDAKSYKVILWITNAGLVFMKEESNLGPRNLYVFDCFYDWQPSAGFVVDAKGEHHNFLYLPCHYDKPEVTVRPTQLAADGEESAKQPAGLAVVSGDPKTQDVAGFWCREVDKWKGADAMGMQLWQRRQRPGEPASRHFLGPETKSDSTPNPATAKMIGKSLYEGHVTLEFSLGEGTRLTGFAVTAKTETKQTMPDAFKKAVKANP